MNIKSLRQYIFIYNICRALIITNKYHHILKVFYNNDLKVSSSHVYHKLLLDTIETLAKQH